MVTYNNEFTAVSSTVTVLRPNDPRASTVLDDTFCTEMSKFQPKIVASDVFSLAETSRICCKPAVNRPSNSTPVYAGWWLTDLTWPVCCMDTEWQTFQLRAHMYQARGLIGSDESGLSDPFARVVFVDQSQCTQVIEETLSPTWDEMLIFNAVVIYGTINSIRNTPPTVVVEVFDQDRGVLIQYIIRVTKHYSFRRVMFYKVADEINPTCFMIK